MDFKKLWLERLLKKHSLDPTLRTYIEKQLPSETWSKINHMVDYWDDHLELLLLFLNDDGDLKNCLSYAEMVDALSTYAVNHDYNIPHHLSGVSCHKRKPLDKHDLGRTSFNDVMAVKIARKIEPLLKIHRDHYGNQWSLPFVNQYDSYEVYWETVTKLLDQIQQGVPSEIILQTWAKEEITLYTECKLHF